MALAYTQWSPSSPVGEDGCGDGSGGRGGGASTGRVGGETRDDTRRVSTETPLDF